MKRTFWLLTAMVLLLLAGGATKQTELSDARAYLIRGHAYGQKGQYDKAISDYTKALEINPRHAVSYGGRGIAYGQKGQWTRLSRISTWL